MGVGVWGPREGFEGVSPFPATGEGPRERWLDPDLTVNGFRMETVPYPGILSIARGCLILRPISCHLSQYLNPVLNRRVGGKQA